MKASATTNLAHRMLTANALCKPAVQVTYFNFLRCITRSILHTFPRSEV